jgi:DNA-binding LytR/AlgR family response regulator
MPLNPSIFTCVIIEDNEINRLTLEHYVSMHEQLSLVASIGSGVAALEFFRGGGQADFILLDIEMPHLNGLELIRLLQEPKPAVVLVTSHSEFAVDAFDLQVVDYVIKPVAYARFCQAVSLVLKRLQVPPVSASTTIDNNLSANGTDLFVKVQGKLMRINFSEVLYIEALSTYVVLVTAKQKFIVGGTLKSIEARLPFQHFVRVHRSYVVNLHRVDAMEDNRLRLGAHEVPVGKSYQEEFTLRLRAL